MENQKISPDGQSVPIEVLEETPGSFRVINQLKNPPKVPKQSVGRLASSIYTVDAGGMALDLIHDLESHPEVLVLGVLNPEGVPVGMVVREELLAFLATQFGRSISHFRVVGDLMKSARAFDGGLDIQQVARELALEISQSKRKYFLLTQGEGGRFFGIFSNVDLMMYLAALSQRDLRVAAEITGALVKEETFLRGDGWDFLASSRPAHGLGGDCYHAIRRGADRLLMILCDVCGKGVPASLVTCYLSGLFERLHPEESVDHMVMELNGKLHRHFGVERFVTGLFCEVDASGGHVRFMDMGHGHLYLVRQGKVLQLKTTTHEVPLGVDPEARVHAHQLTLEPQDVLVLATDGIADQRNAKGESFGLGDLFFDLTHRSRITGDGLVRAREDFMARLDQFRGPVPQTDDITLLLYLHGGDRQGIGL